MKSIKIYDQEDIVEIVDKKIAKIKALIKEASFNEKVLTEKQACEFLQITKPTMIKMRKEKKINYFKVGNELRYKMSDLLKIGK